MRIATHLIVMACGVVGLAGAAQATDLTGSEIKKFLSGKTAYLDTTAASASGQTGQGIIYWGSNGTALYKTPGGGMMHGKWQIKGKTVCTEWKEKPGTGCVRYDKAGDVVTVFDTKSGEARAKITKTAAGNAENLKP